MAMVPSVVGSSRSADVGLVMTISRRVRMSSISSPLSCKAGAEVDSEILKLMTRSPLSNPY
jgi:hypothetical protein